MGVKRATQFLSFSVLLASGSISLIAETSVEQESLAPKKSEDTESSCQPSVKTIEPFTGKITRNRVRLRLSPNLESAILKELPKDECLIIKGVADDFYAVEPQPQMKGYVYRTYVLDNQIEGNNVNVRLEPDTSAPIITQLQTGDVVSGRIAPANSKWVEISLPDSVSFFVAKEYVQRIGDVSIFKEIAQRKSRLEHRLVKIEENMNQELEKPFREIKLAPIAAQLHVIIEQNGDLPHYTERAEAILHNMQESYLQKSMASMQIDLPPSHPKNEQKETIAQAEPDISVPEPSQISSQPLPLPFTEVEAQRVKAAIDQGKASSEDDFYAQELKHGKRLQGIVKPFLRNIKNAPGDFMLIHPKTQVPVAFLYSNKVNLSDFINKEVKIVGSNRPNNDYAFDAYFVLSAEAISHK